MEANSNPIIRRLMTLKSMWIFLELQKELIQLESTAIIGSEPPEKSCQS
jgi:hypothetical protein